ncbi:aminotransferase class I/II-fold pyridoxal phosphate-dependent enzyme [Algoriphagus yeomjeoni]|uniref:aminotransferase class I/II-fold pyridoxal phosphate-dependent enzyme n=1 Tax=Algoriphagus yeomjeoni TaxID=291403 RepID=UPI003CE55D22
MEIKELIIAENNSLRSALKSLDKVGTGVLFIVNNESKLVGIITDGDIRRSLLKDISLEEEISVIMNRNFISLPVGASNQAILESLNDKIKIVPLLNNEGTIVDYATRNRLRKIPIASPQLEGNELAYVSDCIKTNWISSQGKYVREFESIFSNYHRGYHSVAVSNGTVALHLAMEALGIGVGDEVIVPDLTFAASINAIIYTGATPVLVDVDPKSWNLNPELVRRAITKRTKAIMPVHLYGQPCDMNKLMELANEFNLKVIEDCAEALGSKYQGQPVGSFGDAATFSFFGNKTITTGEGGMVLFKDQSVFELATVLRDHGMNKTRRYWHDVVGYNYRLTNLQAAIGVAQFERLATFVDRKRVAADSYNAVLSKSPYFEIPQSEELNFNSYWLYTFLIRDNAPFDRDEFMDYMTNKSIETRPIFYPLHEMPPYQAYGDSKELMVSESISRRGVSLPSSVNLMEGELEYICRTISEFLDEKEAIQV